MIHKIDISSIAEFVERVRGHSSPLGDALRRHDISFHEMIGQTVVDQLQSGANLLLGINLPNRHLAHVQLFNEEVLRVSDYDEPVNLDYEKQYDTILITPP